jgi:hypothetical protein
MEHKTEDDLDRWGLDALDHWEQFRPRMCKELLAKGELYDVLWSIQEEAKTIVRQLAAAGQPRHVAEEVATYQCILVPEETPEPEPKPLGKKNPTPHKTTEP